MDKEGKKLLYKIYFNCLAVTLFAITAIGLAIFFYNQNIDLKSKIKEHEERIEYLASEVERYEMIGNEFEELFINCVEGDK